MTHPGATHPWIEGLQTRLDRLEVALLQGDAPAVERTSAELQASLQQAPRTADLVHGHASALQAAARRFAQLRAATVRAGSYYNIARIYEAAEQYDDALRHYHLAKEQKANPVYDKAILRVQDRH